MPDRSEGVDERSTLMVCGVKWGVRISAVVLLLLGTLGISTAYGMMLLLPLYVNELGGTEADFGVVFSSATLTAVLCIGLLIRYPEALRPHVVVALAVATYGLGATGTSLVTGGWTPLIGIGVLLGTAWAVVYAATPMAMSGMVTDEGRAAYFGYLTGTQQVGIGAGPVIARFLVSTPLGFRGTFMAAGLVCLGAVVLTLIGGVLAPDTRTNVGTENPSGNEVAAVPFGAAIRRIVGSEAAFPLVMVLLFACLFTSMTSFQPAFAATRGLDYSVFYVTYTVAVIFSRFVLAGMVSRFDSNLVIATSVSVMALAVASFFVVGSGSLLYGVSSASLGLGYGLALPSVQARAVNVSAEPVRPRVLPVTGMLFEAAILGFPLIAGRVITSFGYQALFAVLLAIALAQVAIAWWRFLVVRRTSSTRQA
jgi:MFS family permease